MEKPTGARKKQAARQSRADDSAASRQGSTEGSQSDYRDIFHAVDAAILVHDIESGAVMDANRKACEIYGCNVEEIRQLIPGGWSSGDPPYTTEAALARIQQAASGEPQRFEWRATSAAGRAFWVEVSLNRTRIGGKDRVLAV